MPWPPTSPPRRRPSISEPIFDRAFQGRLADLFRWRRDVRGFTDEPVSPELLDHLLDLADLAPSVGLSQPWRFVVVDDPARRQAVRDNFARSNAQALAARGEDASLYARLKLAGLDQAPCHLAVFAEPDPAQGRGLGRATMPQTLAFSAVMAVHTHWLAARAEGLGMGWVSILDPNEINATLDVPADWAFIGYFCLGTPSARSAVPELERLGWETRSLSRGHRLHR
jgi:5,6-dimethylbenzimidazole synthase